MAGLPKLPGNQFTDPTKSRFNISQTLSYKNGYQMPAAYPSVGVGGDPINPAAGLALNESELDQLANFQPTLTYGQARQQPPAQFVPGHVAFDKKVLRFFGYFKETVNESPAELFRVRHVVIYYYLEDDTMTISEPPQNNSGIPQGKLIRRQRLPRDELGNHWTWKHLNVGVNLCVYGRVYRLVDCDAFTRQFLTSEGICVDAKEALPVDPYLSCRAAAEQVDTYKTPSSFDKRRQFLEMDKKVLRFYAVWDDRDEMFGECRNFIIHYYLVDDTMEVKEVHTANDGRDPFPVLIRRDKIPKNRDQMPNAVFPSAVTENDLDYFSPRDFQLGATLVVLGRRFLVYDCDDFTRMWLSQHLGGSAAAATTSSPALTAFQHQQKQQLAQTQQGSQHKAEIPPYNGFGSLEDSLGNCFSLIPSPPKKDFIKQMSNDQKVLRYEAKLNSIRSDDLNRRFIISFFLSDDMVSVFEIPSRNSGFPAGGYLKKTRIARPGSTPEHPSYYGPADFWLKAKIEVFGQTFIIINADLYVLNFMESVPQQFPAEMIQQYKEHFERELADRQTRSGGRFAPMEINREPGDLMRVMNEIKWQIKKLAIIDRERIDAMFLYYNKDRNGSVDATCMKDICKKLNLPQDDDVVACLLNEFGTDGKMNLEEFRAFFEN